MSYHKGLSEWSNTVITQMPHLSTPQAVVLAMWSFGMAIMGCCGLTTVSAFLANLLGKNENSVRQRLREWYRGKEDKKGEKRQEIEVKTCFAPLARWVLSWWPPDEKRIAIGLDATTLADRFTILAISILYRGCAIPIAWVILRGNQKGSWKPHWLGLLNDLDKVIPSDWTVIALTDRGLYALWLYNAIKKIGWHPFMRINQQGTYRPEDQVRFRPLKKCVPTKGSSWSGKATCFKSNPLKCTLLACWEEGYDHPWLIVTDLEPEQANVCWYGLRTWIECGFKDNKRGGWQWQNSKITDPARAERIWLAIAVATLWMVSVGGQADANMPASGFDELPETHIARRLKKNQPSRARLLSCFRRGRTIILATLLRGESIPLGSFLPEIWPNKLKQTTVKKNNSRQKVNSNHQATAAVT